MRSTCLPALAAVLSLTVLTTCGRSANEASHLSPSGGTSSENERKPQTVDDVLGSIENEEVKQTISRAITRDKQIKDGMVAEILANKECPFTENELNSKNIDELEKFMKLAGSSKTPEDFSARVPAPAENAAENSGVPKMPTMFAKKD